MRNYNKLVRDRIPEIIQNDNKTCVVEILNDHDFLVELKRKLIEESNELSGTQNREEMINELADLHEVMNALKAIYAISNEEIERRQLKKAETNGRFEKQLFLVSVDGDHE